MTGDHARTPSTWRAKQGSPDEVARSVPAAGVRGPSERVPAWTLAVVAMLSVQIGSALSTHLFATVGPGGTAWLRLTAGAVIFLAISRAPVRGLARADAGLVIAVGVATGMVTVAFLSAIERIPLGTAVAIEFLGPLGVAVFHRPNPRRLVWPALALAGVVLLTEPWLGAIDPIGVILAAAAGCGWATYIVLTQRVGDRLVGLQGLSLTIPIAAMTAAVAVLSQVPSGLQVVGVVLVVVAGVGAERGGHREDHASRSLPPPIG